ncbi:MAG: hypothetical protein WCA24_01980 [Thiomonas sp.]
MRDLSARNGPTTAGRWSAQLDNSILCVNAWIGSILMQAMIKAGSPARFAAGDITAPGALGIPIPSSIVW